MAVVLDRPSTGETGRKQRADLVARAADLGPTLRRNAERTEDGRRLAEENVAAIEAAGLFRLTQPKRFGGFQADFRTKIEVIRELAHGCGSTGWTTSLLTGGTWFIGMWNEQVQKDVWGEDSEARVAGVLAPTGTATAGPDGLTVSGRWSYCTGCLHAHWLYLGVPVVDVDGNSVDHGLVLVPAAEVTIEDTWFVAGMRGSGSNTVVADQVVVPPHRFISLRRLQTGGNDSPYSGEELYRVPFVVAAMTDLVGPQLGLARAALEFVLEQASRRGIAYTEYTTQVDSPAVQLAVAKAATLIDTAELLTFRAVAEIDEAGRLGVFPDRRTRARCRMDVAQAIVNAREAIRELVSVHGSAGFAESSPLQRIWRDSEVASRHAVANPAIGAQVYGRALLGLGEGVTPLV
ncbi:acyl-CoA dehydrogenase family protein [Saccharopolyspora sp. K220]|uniref:acyl-CoA dehydrogenase family protein n=1 Tax=Saccharopolyspora soli TaxID=2926618 RepID=UPI001F58F49D|nr:acyl-CoA dehydrogenase family protein [Saccharopolyspora soli]MCI2422948.1 acyl-CoA dehydrogenase family protein [Saccharopolyspora soli]